MKGDTLKQFKGIQQSRVNWSDSDSYAGTDIGIKSLSYADTFLIPLL